MSAASPPLHAFISSAGFEGALAGELGAVDRAEGEPRWPSIVTVRRALPSPVDPIFARQQMPSASFVRGETPADAAEAAFAVFAPVLDAEDRTFTLHVFVPNAEQYQSLSARVQETEAALLAVLRARRRASFRRYAARPARARWAEVVVLQVAIVGRTSLLVSAARPRALPSGGFDLMPWPAGIAPVADDKTAPSRAYGKFEEALRGWFMPAAASRVDLGGSPGGWSWKALVRRA